jgi:two-component system KDP operon response regulator KdpE
MSNKDRILIVDDEENITRFLSMILTANNYDIDIAKTGTEAISIITSFPPDLILLDLGLPDIDGIGVLKAVREWTSLPIIVVSARTSEREKVEALDLGADDYITKPFGHSELLARVRTAIRHAMTSRADSDAQKTGKYSTGDMIIDYDKHIVMMAGKNVHLTQNEYKIVALLAKNAGKLLTYDYLLKEIWGPSLKGDNQILRVNMANIRRKIEKNTAEPEYIFTEVGIGYWLREE